MHCLTPRLDVSQSKRRTQANQAGIDFVIKLRAEHGEVTTGLDPLTPSDELELVSFYAYKLAAKGMDLWPRKVIATAVTFLKRFYLDQSCIQHEVRKIAFACLYIAGKVCRLMLLEAAWCHPSVVPESGLGHSRQAYM